MRRTHRWRDALKMTDSIANAWYLHKADNESLFDAIVVVEPDLTELEHHDIDRLVSSREVSLELRRGGVARWIVNGDNGLSSEPLGSDRGLGRGQFGNILRAYPDTSHAENRDFGVIQFLLRSEVGLITDGC
jgi:hypothetical protein